MQHAPEVSLDGTDRTLLVCPTTGRLATCPVSAIINVGRHGAAEESYKLPSRRRQHMGDKPMTALARQNLALASFARADEVIE